MRITEFMRFFVIVLIMLNILSYVIYHFMYRSNSFSGIATSFIPVLLIQAIVLWSISKINIVDDNGKSINYLEDIAYIMAAGIIGSLLVVLIAVFAVVVIYLNTNRIGESIAIPFISVLSLIGAYWLAGVVANKV